MKSVHDCLLWLWNRDEFDISKLNYDKIIILTDADGWSPYQYLITHIFYRFMPELILQGKIYRGLPPHYRVEYETREREKIKISIF